MSYRALVCSIRETIKHPNADRIQIARVAGGYEVIVSIDAKVGDLGIYFDTDGQLSDEFCKANNLYAIKDPTTGKKIGGGFFDERRRVTAQKFRGVKSDGFWVPLHYLSYCISEEELAIWQEGILFNEVKGHPICNKYVTARTQYLQNKVNNNTEQAKSRKHYGDYKCLHRHIETEKLKTFIHAIPKKALLTISIKEHGTSAVTSFVTIEHDLKWYQNLFNKIFPNMYPKYKYKHMVGTRNVVFRDGYTPGKDGFRWTAANSFMHKLRKGETVYYEIVGYADNNIPIMGKHNLDSLKEYKGKSLFPKEMTYSYGCSEGHHKISVYRITMTNEDGFSYDLTPAQCQARCIELGIDFVKVVEQYIYDGDQQKLLDICDKYLSNDELKPSLLCTNHIEEGVVVRVDYDKVTPMFLKAKSFLFMVLEGVYKDNPDNEDREEAA